MNQHYCSRKSLPGHRHGKLFISGPCRKWAADLLKLSKHQLKMVVAILTGHAPVRTHLRTMDLFEGDPTCRFCKKEGGTVQHIICCCEASARQRFNVFGCLIVEPTDIRTASVRDLCLLVTTVLFPLALQPSAGCGLLVSRGFLITHNEAPVGRTPLNEWSARRRDLYLTTHNTHDKHPCPRWDSNTRSQQASGRRPTT
jgi:hypothetical protein